MLTDVPAAVVVRLDDLGVVSTTINGSGMTGNVGCDLLRRFVFTIDYADKRADFTPNDLFGVYTPYKPTGVSATRQPDGRLRIIAVDPGSAASRPGIHVGDTLVAINGYPIARLDAAQLSEAATADSVTYAVRRGDRERAVNLP
jgi:S1-C subfamily serine protease